VRRLEGTIRPVVAYNGHADLHLTARDMAKFGQLYLDDGAYDGNQIVPAAWVERSLRVYSDDAWRFPVGKHFTDMGYGYQWWSATAGIHRFHFAWGPGGQLIALLEPYDMVVVVTADPLFGQHGSGPWKREKENLNLVGDFFASLLAAAGEGVSAGP
jgi:CubicO group peptidase (beta-lactamase class C family)